ncbi:MAG: glycoside hydrolase [Chloroflexi bacterium]|nr:glycoside hydrolase [Chloroflexota bacterium]
MDGPSVTAQFPSFALRCEGLPGSWALSTTPADEPVEVTVELPGFWYGGGELIHQQFPLNKVMLQCGPFHTWDNGPTGLSGILTPAWFSSQGALVIADSPVEVGVNQPPAGYPRFPWTLAAEGRGAFSERPFPANGRGDGVFTFKGRGLSLKASFSENAVEAHGRLVEHFGHPRQIPPEDLFAHPTWTTWARHKTAIHQDLVLQFADDIIRHDFPYNVLEIDDRWQVHYGDLGFDPQRFPDPKVMIDELHAKGFKVTAWVIPFLEPQSQAFTEGAARGWLVRTADGRPYSVPWWQGRGGLLDVTHPSALAWFFGRLKQLQLQTGLDGFKFDAGEACFLPADAITHRGIHANDYTRIYVESVAEHYRLTEVRAGWKNQPAPIFFRQWDKATSWGLDNGLHSVLTGSLALGLAGYPFILPDMVGGNEYQERADAELMIRWTQVNALLPAMQFSLAPWDHGTEAAELCRRYANLHVDFAPRILGLAREAARTGAPIVRPVFWLAPDDERALGCDDEFLLGDDILAAPVVSPGQRARDIYLPPGRWRDHWTREEFEGALVLRGYPAPLDVLPLFERLQQAESLRPSSREE